MLQWCSQQGGRRREGKRKIDIRKEVEKKGGEGEEDRQKEGGRERKGGEGEEDGQKEGGIVGKKKVIESKVKEKGKLKDV